MKYIVVIVLCFLSLSSYNIQAKDIVLKINCSVGQAPTLPSMVKVKNEWRQVKWSNTTVDAEREESAKPVGTKYSIDGLLLGTNQPVTAKVTMVGGNDAPPTIKAHPLPLADVRLAGDNLLTKNRDRDIERLLSLDMSQQLYNYYDTYGLPTQGMTVSDGWDSPDTKLYDDKNADTRQLEAAKTLDVENKEKLDAVAPLQQFVAQLKKDNPNPDATLKERLDYADMVIRYVIDGSGTMDMIRKAMEKLR